MFCIEYVTKNEITNDFDYSKKTKLQVERYFFKTKIVNRIRHENALNLFVYDTGNLDIRIGDKIIFTNENGVNHDYKIIDLKHYQQNHFEIIGVL